MLPHSASTVSILVPVLVRSSHLVTSPLTPPCPLPVNSHTHYPSRLDLKHPSVGRLYYVDLGGGRHRTGGSALATVYGQLGDAPPDLETPEALQGLRRAFDCVQVP